MQRSRLVVASSLVCSFMITGMFVDRVTAGDWPQIMGPHRNGIADDERLADMWPAEGPKELWKESIGSGFAGVAVVDKTAILFHREKSDDKLTAFHSETGERIWTTNFPSRFRPQIVDDDGPRAVPTIHQGMIYAYSSEGKLYCVDLKTGKKRWERKTHQDFKADGGYFGAGSAPLIEGRNVIVNVGGDKMNAGVVAFQIDSGETSWTAVNDQASYSAPIAVTVNETRHLLCVTRLNLVSLDPATGKERFRSPFGQRGPTVNAAIPILSNDHLLVTASYGIGAQWLKLNDESVDVVWADEVLSSQYTTPILHDGAVYGIDGRQDGGSVTLKCFDPISRKVHWSKPWDEYSTLIGTDHSLLVMHTNGVLKMVRLNKSKYEEMASAKLLSGKTRALPALSNGRLYVRNENTLVCVDLGAH